MKDEVRIPGNYSFSIFRGIDIAAGFCSGRITSGPDINSLIILLLKRTFDRETRIWRIVTGMRYTFLSNGFK